MKILRFIKELPLFLHKWASSDPDDTHDSSPMSNPDVETFHGKIICDIDGSPCILDSENETFSKLTYSSTTGPISAKNYSSPCSPTDELPGISQTNNPKIHTFRVINSQNVVIGNKNDFTELKTEKPILMCFICKLSFGNTKSFITHANNEHNLNLLETEEHLLKTEFSSAIIQRNMDEKPQISFLEPIADQMEVPQQTSVETNINDVDYDNTGNVNSSEVEATPNTNVTALPSSQTDKTYFSNINASSLSKEVKRTNTPTEAIETHETCTDNLSSFKFASKNNEKNAPTDANVDQLMVCSYAKSKIKQCSQNQTIDTDTEKQDETPQDFTMNSTFSDAETRLQQINTLHASLAALSKEQQFNGNVKLISDFLQQQIQTAALQQQQMQQSLPTCPEHVDGKGIDCKNCEQIEAHYQLNTTPIRSPNNMHAVHLPASPTSASTIANAAPCFTIGACSDHINGRPVGVDCSRCEMILNSARLNNGSQLSTRNSCKTLKCPQCNWHYKYQETLEIHMREKHPDGESACGYCLAGQQHPRLARGESYSCGYKPYRCEICNYSTTTKGNLSIHMQSDKHLNNMQELNSTQNIVAAAVSASTNIDGGQNKVLLANNNNVSQQTSQQQASLVSPAPSSTTASLNNSTMNSVSTSANKSKPNFRCDICSYETTVARNLRIHMTSEKHTHNMAILQSNIKQIHALSMIQQQQQQHQQQRAINNNNNIGTLSQYPGPSIAMNNFLPEVAIADLAYNQAIMIQMLQQNAAAAAAATNSSHSNSSISSEIKASQRSSSPQSKAILNEFASQKFLENHLDSNASSIQKLGSSSIINDTIDFPPVKPDPWPTAIYTCQVCSVFTTNSLDELNQHILFDRSRSSNGANNDIMLIQNNNYICRLCNYKTNLKANFQLHSKTDKHLQKLNYINHIREGGPFNEYKLKFLQHQQVAANMVHLKCNCCDFLTNSIQKLTLHSQHMTHDTMSMIFQQLLGIIQKYKLLQNEKINLPESNSNLHCKEYKNFHRSLECQLCNYTAANLLEMVQHVKSVRHMQIEQFVCLQRNSEKMPPLNIEDVFKLSEPILKSEDNLKEELNNETKNTCDNSTEETETSKVPCSRIFDKHDENEVSREETTGILSDIHQCPNQLQESVPFIIYKCSHCEFVAQIKREIEVHLETVHPNSESEDFITIPTNAAAIQAFKAAMAAVTLSVGKRSSISPNNTYIETDNNTSVSIKRETPDTVSNEYAYNSVEHKEQNDENINDNGSLSVMKLTTIQCPLCHDIYNDKCHLEDHLIRTHTVKRDGLSRLLQLVDKSMWKDTSKSSERYEADELNDNFNTSSFEFICQVCESNFKYVEQLLQHAQNSQHYALKNGEYMCLAANNVHPCSMTFAALNSMLSHYKDIHMSLVISERHVYKYRCKQCSLAFKTQEKLTAHSLYHTMRDATKCVQCQKNFRTTQAMQKHMEQIHNVKSTSSTETDKSSDINLSTTSVNSSEVSGGNGRNSQLSSPVTDFEGPVSSPKEHKNTDSAQRSVSQQGQNNLSLTENDNNQTLLSNPVQNISHEQNIANNFQNILTQPLQNLQTLHQMQAQLPQMAAAVAAAGIPINPVDMLSLMQFHHLLSINFMNLAPPLVFQGASPTNVGCASKSTSFADVQGAENSIPSAATTPNTDCNNPQPIAQEQSPNSAQFSNNQKRARTRITDDQLKILRAHFDINNSPSEESIMEMSQKANLPMKVVKHWFRNTLFKERQRNKDSPYNFNNPPSTTLNLEEYERTGQTKVTSLSENNDSPSSSNAIFYNKTNQSRPSSTISAGTSTINSNIIQHNDIETDQQPDICCPETDSTVLSPLQDKINIKTEPTDQVSEESFEKLQQNSKLISKAAMMASFIKQHLVDQSSQDMRCHSPSNVQHQSHPSQIQQNTYSSYETKSESGSSEVLSRPQSPTSTSAHSMFSGMNDLLGQQMDNIPLMSNLNNMGPPKKFQVTKSFEKNSPSSQFDTNSNSSNSSSSSGKRANRTRFTDYQIKVLQEFFENNSYPKDSDLEYLSKLLLLSPRVIVVWFQNARQKQRKIYENQPNNTIFENEDKKQNINYTCKKCSLVFQRYYELIRHQKNHCFKEENNKKSAKAQIAAAQIAQNFSSEDSNSSLEIHNSLSTNSILGVFKPNIGTQNCGIPSNISGAFGQTLSCTSPQQNSIKSFSPPNTPTPPHSSNNSLEKSHEQNKQKLQCENCKLSFSSLDQLKSHQIIHVMDDNINTSAQNETSAVGSFGNLLQSLQQAAAMHHQQNFPELQSPTPKKRKLSETFCIDEYSSFPGMAPKVDESLVKKHEILFQYFMQNESNQELKQQFLLRRQCTPDIDVEIEFLSNYYQESESKKITNYDYLYQYFVKNEELLNHQEHLLRHSPNEKPNLEYLLRYYQLNESRKFFPLEASPQPLTDSHPSEPKSYMLDTDSTANKRDINNEKNSLLQENMDKKNDKPNKKDMKDVANDTNSTISTQNASNSYFNNLEDFLDATMVENDTQTLTFNTDITQPNIIEQTTITNPKVPNDKQNKRLRTTILPEQLNFLYECYQNESNPSRKMLEEIAKKVNLKKRVVQVWFQNSRAKDKKSRNQRQYSGISDDNSSHDDITRDANQRFNCKNAVKPTIDSDSSNPISNENIQDCEICQVEQVDIKKHTFTFEHIRNVKAILHQSAISSEKSKSISDNTSGSDDIEFDDPSKKGHFDSNIMGNIQIQNEHKLRSVISNPTYFKNDNLIDDGHQQIDPIVLHRPEHENEVCDEATKTISNQQQLQQLTETVKDTVSKKSHLNDIIRKFFNCNQITVIGGK